jgi:hypothetical protein
MSVTRAALQANVAEPTSAWQRALGTKETVAPLAELPEGLVFDEGLDEPIWYDGTRRQLRYRGFMCNASYVQLRRLCDHPAYIAALEQLYLGSAEEESRPLGRMLLKIGAPLTALAAVVGALVFWLR